jgi:hypothetical protein
MKRRTFLSILAAPLAAMLPKPMSTGNRLPLSDHEKDLLLWAEREKFASSFVSSCEEYEWIGVATVHPPDLEPGETRIIPVRFNGMGQITA